MTVSLPDLNDPNAVLNYGAEAQAKIADFSEMILQNSEGEQTEDVSDKITTLITRLRAIAEEKNATRFPFRKGATATKIRYRKACETVDRIARSLQNQRDRLMRDIEMLEILHTMNLEQYRALTEYVEQGKEALEHFCKNHSNNGEIASDPAGRFEKKLHDLELTRTISLQMAPQIRLLQNNNVMLAEKIQEALIHVIPLWKNQIVFALTMNATKQALKTQEKISDLTNTLLQQNAKNLRETTLTATRCAQRGHTTVQTLSETNGILLETLDRMMKLQEEGRQARRDAEEELRRLNREIRLRFTERKNAAQLP